MGCEGVGGYVCGFLHFLVNLSSQAELVFLCLVSRNVATKTKFHGTIRILCPSLLYTISSPTIFLPQTFPLLFPRPHALTTLHPILPVSSLSSRARTRNAGNPIGPPTPGKRLLQNSRSKNNLMSDGARTHMIWTDGLPLEMFVCDLIDCLGRRFFVPIREGLNGGFFFLCLS